MTGTPPFATPTPVQPAATVTSAEARFPPSDPLPAFVPPAVTDPVSNLDFLPVGDAFALEMRTETIEQLCAERGLGAAIVPNFALGAAVLLHLARVAAQHFDWAEIIELHHDKKADAPSGTSLHIAREMVASRGQDFQRAETAKFTLADVRAGQQGGVGIHSVRLPGFVAHQEVIFGGLGQTLTLRHDSTSRESFLPGALVSLRYVLTSTGVTVGLDKVLGLE